jgi:hypothetical protein
VFVRWKRRRVFSVDRDGYEHYTETAYVVRSERTADGPRQRVVCYLGGIRWHLDDRGREEEISLGGKRAFWERANTALDRAGIEGDDRAKVLAALGWLDPDQHEVVATKDD